MEENAKVKREARLAYKLARKKKLEAAATSPRQITNPDWLVDEASLQRLNTGRKLAWPSAGVLFSPA